MNVLNTRVILLFYTFYYLNCILKYILHFRCILLFYWSENVTYFAVGVVSIGAVLAIEIEHEMYLKYVITAPGAAKKDYNKRDYKQHYLMLMRNLKQKHNDSLVRTNMHTFTFMQYYSFTFNLPFFLSFYISFFPTFFYLITPLCFILLLPTSFSITLPPFI